MKPLTRRQQEFLSKLLDLYHDSKEPVHYSTLAEHLGVGRVTAYEMLRLLEERKLVQTEFFRPEDPSVPGRASVRFRPTALAARALKYLAGGAWNDDDWREAKKRILQVLRASEDEVYRTLIDELLVCIPNQQSVSAYLAEMSAVIVLSLHSLRQDAADAYSPKKVLRSIGFPSDLDLNALLGLGVGLSLVGSVNRRLASVLSAQANKFQSALATLSAENRRRIAAFTKEMVETLGS